MVQGSLRYGLNNYIARCREKQRVTICGCPCDGIEGKYTRCATQIFNYQRLPEFLAQNLSYLASDNIRGPTRRKRDDQANGLGGKGHSRLCPSGVKTDGTDYKYQSRMFNFLTQGCLL